MLQQNSARCLLVLVSLLLGACTSNKPLLPEPLLTQSTQAPAQDQGISASALSDDSKRETGLQSTPKPPPASKLSTIKPSVPAIPAKEEEANITLAFDQLPLPDFVQTIFSQILKKNFSMDPQVASRKDLVTLRAAQPQTPAQIESATRLLLKTYGVAIIDLGAGNYRITPDNTQSGYAPELLRGRALPEVPLPLRPIYQLVELQAVRSSEVAGWLVKIFGPKVNVIDDVEHNTLILSGQSDDVATVLDAIQVLDQPLMKGRHSQRINPVFWSADELGKRLSEILIAEGYGVTTTPALAGSHPINLIPIQGINALIVFAADPAVMQHIIGWAKDLDKPNASPGAGGGYFTYQVRNTNAETLAKTIQAVLGDGQAPPAQNIPPGAVVVGTPSAPIRSGRVIVNPATNTLIFQGGSENRTHLFSLLQELDKPAKAALIEVTVAEVTLDNTTQLGVEWAFNTSGAKGSTYTGGTLAGVPLGGGFITGGIGIGTSGLTIARLNSAGDLRLLLNLLATSSDSNVLSSPRILVRNGETASIQVGSEIPTITSQQTNAATGGTGVLQSVQYRKTGVILNVKPTLYAGDRIDLTVTQEVSDSTRVGVAGSPIIDTRRVETNLSLKDGSPVLLGGLISQNKSRTETGIPLLKDIPILGQLFRTNTDNTRKTEMLVLITPYIVSDDHDAKKITEAFRNQLGEWAQPKAPPTPPLKTVPTRPSEEKPNTPPAP